MPYTSISALPESVRNALPTSAQKIWMNAYNHAVRRWGEKPSQNAQYAWGAVKRVFKKADGKWVRKRQSGPDPEVGISLPAPLAEAVVEGRITMLVSGTKAPSSFVGTPVYFYQENTQYGIMTLGRANGPYPVEATIKEFQEDHKVTLESFKEEYPESAAAWLYTFELNELYDPPREGKPRARWIVMESPKPTA